MTEVAKRDNQGKPDLSFVFGFPVGLESVSRVMEFGAIKYSRDNWTKGGKPDCEYLGACLRHISKYMNEGHIDLESGCNHLGHAIWNLMALLQLNDGVAYDPEVFTKALKEWELEMTTNSVALNPSKETCSL